mgnify:FL=1
MKNRHSYILKSLILILLTSPLLSNFVIAADNIDLAVIQKIIKDVKKKSSQNDYAPASTGDVLFVGDQVQTGKGSLALIKFKDKSIVRLREQSVLTMNGVGKQNSFIKENHLTQGSLEFEVQKQKAELFRLTSPTSVASIRGTKGKWSGGQGHDTLVVTEGRVNLKNKISGNETDVDAGSIGFSNEDGSVYSRIATEEELADAISAASNAKINELKLEMQDSKGNKKELKLRYKQQ